MNIKRFFKDLLYDFKVLRRYKNGIIMSILKAIMMGYGSNVWLGAGRFIKEL